MDMNRKTDSKKTNWNLYLYLLLVGYIIIAILLSGLWAQSKGLSPQEAAKIAANYTALPFLGWLILTAYYLVRWSGQRMGWLQKEGSHHPERQPAKA